MSLKEHLEKKILDKFFYVQYWFDDRAKRYRFEDYSQQFSKAECNDLLKKVFEKSHNFNLTFNYGY